MLPCSRPQSLSASQPRIWLLATPFCEVTFKDQFIFAAFLIYLPLTETSYTQLSPAVPHLRPFCCACSFRDSLGAYNLQPTSAPTNFVNLAVAGAQHERAKDTRNSVVYNSEFYCPSIPILLHNTPEHDIFRAKVNANHALETTTLPGNPELLKNQLRSCGRIAVQAPHTIDTPPKEGSSSAQEPHLASWLTAWLPLPLTSLANNVAGGPEQVTSQHNGVETGRPCVSSGFIASQGVKSVQDQPGFYPSPYSRAVPSITESCGSSGGCVKYPDVKLAVIDEDSRSAHACAAPTEGQDARSGFGKAVNHVTPTSGGGAIAGKYPDVKPVMENEKLSAYVPQAPPEEQDACFGVGKVDNRVKPVSVESVLHVDPRFGCGKGDNNVALELHPHATAQEMKAAPAPLQYPSPQPHYKPTAGDSAATSQGHGTQPPSGSTQYPGLWPVPARDRVPITNRYFDVQPFPQPGPDLVGAPHFGYPSPVNYDVTTSAIGSVSSAAPRYPAVVPPARLPSSPGGTARYPTTQPPYQKLPQSR
jgi:hypothetical protein